MFAYNFNTMRLLVLLFLISSCTNEVVIPNNVTKLVITYPVANSSDSISFTESNLKEIDLFKEVLKGKSEKTDCKQIGTIDFIAENNSVLHFGFTIVPPSCVFLIQNDKAWRLTYRAGMYLDYIFREKLKKRNE
jgi:hypothetical protein